MLRRTFAIALALVAGITATASFAQPYPNRPVKIVVPFAAGSATDIAARLMADELRQTLGQSFVIDNKPGASARIGAETVAKAPPDGYTLLVTTNTSHSANPHLFKTLSYDPIRDFAPVAGIMNIPVIIVVNPKSTARSLGDLIAQAKAQPGKLSYGYGNSIGQVTAAAFAKAAGIQVTAVPYKSSPQAMTDLMGDQLAYAVTDMAAGQALVASGKLRALAVSSEKRSSIMPDLPAMNETPSLAGFELVAWIAMFAPAGTPPEIVNTLGNEMRRALAKPAIREKIAGFSADVTPHTPAELGSFVRAQLVNWGKRIKDAGIEPE